MTGGGRGEMYIVVRELYLSKMRRMQQVGRGRRARKRKMTCDDKWSDPWGLVLEATEARITTDYIGYTGKPYKVNGRAKFNSLLNSLATRKFKSAWSFFCTF
jgi:hypothetical protein